MTTVKIASPGNDETHHWLTNRRPSETILPHSAVGGTTPSPRKLSPANVMMALPTSSVSSTINAPSAFGKMCNTRVRAGPQPSGLFELAHAGRLAE